MRITPFIVAAILAASVLPARAQTPTSTPAAPLSLRDYHGWGRFHAGSWRRVKVTKETFNKEGEIASVSVTEAKTTLQMAGAYSFELLTESTIEVAGQRYSPAPQRSRNDYYGVPKEALIKRVRESEFVLNGIKKKCQVFEVVVNNDKSKRVTRFHVSENGAPIILRQETAATSAEGQKQFEIKVDVLALDMPRKVLADTVPCAYLRTVQDTADKRVITVEAYSEAVPGGVVSQSVKILDRAGKMLERHTAELVDYGRVSVKSTSSPLRSRIFRPRSTRRK